MKSGAQITYRRLRKFKSSLLIIATLFLIFGFSGIYFLFIVSGTLFISLGLLEFIMAIRFRKVYVRWMLVKANGIFEAFIMGAFKLGYVILGIFVLIRGMKLPFVSSARLTGFPLYFILFILIGLAIFFILLKIILKISKHIKKVRKLRKGD